VELLWALIGLMLTIGGTFIEGFVTINLPWYWSNQGVALQSLGVYCQVGAGLLTACLGGKNAGALSQIAYVVIGLTLLPVFSNGGGLTYLRELSFGYLLGFIPGAWLCGWWVERYGPSLEQLAIGSFLGLLPIHLCGILYLGLLRLWGVTSDQGLVNAMEYYSLIHLPGQLGIVCAVAVIAYGLRRLMFY
jgi:biotin transport system substrate-specific component